MGAVGFGALPLRFTFGIGGAVGRCRRLGAVVGLSLGAEAQRRLEREREREQHAQQWRERKRR